MEFIDNLKTVLSKIEALGGDARTIRIDSPASEDQILSVEKEIGLSIPKELRNLIQNYSSHFEFSWFLDYSFALPEELSGIFCGDLHWGLDLLPSLIESYRGWIEDVFPNTDDSYVKSGTINSPLWKLVMEIYLLSTKRNKLFI